MGTEVKMSCIVMAYIVMAYIVMAYVTMTCIVVALYSHGLKESGYGHGGDEG